MTLVVNNKQKPRLVFFRGTSGNIPEYINSHLRQHVKCLSVFFDVTTINGACDYGEICDRHQPDLTLFESGTYGAPRDIRNTSSFLDIPKLGFLHADAYCLTRSVFLSDMERWGIQTYFTNSVSMAEYVPAIADSLFVWPNFVDPEVHRDYGESKTIPVLFTGSQAVNYLWRNRIRNIVGQHYPSLTCPHFGWFGVQETSRMIYDEKYARMLNASCVVPTCGTIAKEVVRKHFEIPGCGACLVTEQTPALEAAGFVDMQNCVFANEADVLDKLDRLFNNPDVLRQISRSGHQLVHSRHTFRQRDQIFQWFMLGKFIQANQRIVQTRPFAPLVIVDKSSGRRNSHSLSNGVHGVLLRIADTHLRQHNYDEAELCYFKCLNYWNFMPEPMLGLALCSLFRGDARRALEWIAQPITRAIETYKAADPDPVEWAYFIISLLCQGNVEEATRRAYQYPFLHHAELERCRTVVDALNSSTYAARDLSECATWRPSVHQLPERDMVGWINELCAMLKACRQIGLAEKLHNVVFRDPIGAVISPRVTRPTVISSSLDKPSVVLPLLPGPFYRKIGKGLTLKMRALMMMLDIKFPRSASRLRALRAALRSLGDNTDEFALVVQRCALEGHLKSALVIAGYDFSVWTSVFLASIRENPSMPIIFCVAHSEDPCRELQRRFSKQPCVKFSTKAIGSIKQESGLEYFDMVLIDGPMPNEWDECDELMGAETILISDINGYPNHKIARRFLSDAGYRLADQNPSHLNGYAVFTKSGPLAVSTG